MHSVFDVYIRFLVCQRKHGSILFRLTRKLLQRLLTNWNRSVSLKFRFASDFTLIYELFYS